MRSIFASLAFFAPTAHHRSLFLIPDVLFIIIAVIFALYFLCKRGKEKLDSRRKERIRQRAKEALRLSNPEGGGPPIIPGGLATIPENQRYSYVERRAQSIATLVTSASPSELRVGYARMVKLFSGPLMVAYKDDFVEEKVFKGEVAYEVLLLGVAGSQKVFTAYILWANGCGCWQTTKDKVRTEPVLENGRPVQLTH